MTWTSGETIVASRLEDKNDRNAANGYAGLISSRISTNQANLDIIWDESNKKVFTSFTSGLHIYHSHDIPSSMQGQTYTKLKSIQLGYLPNTSLIIYYETKPQGEYGNLTNIYRNAGAVGTERATAGNGDTYQAYTETVSGWVTLDTLEVWGKSTGLSASCSVQNLRILGASFGLQNS